VPAGRVAPIPAPLPTPTRPPCPQYRGRLDTPAVLRALCAGFSEGTEPPVCLSGGLNVDDCASGRDTCWHYELTEEGGGSHKLSACVDTFRGYVCHCPIGASGLAIVIGTAACGCRRPPCPKGAASAAVCMPQAGSAGGRRGGLAGSVGRHASTAIESQPAHLSPHRPSDQTSPTSATSPCCPPAHRTPPAALPFCQAGRAMASAVRTWTSAPWGCLPATSCASTRRGPTAAPARRGSRW
jgi:hypothetical protein